MDGLVAVSFRWRILFKFQNESKMSFNLTYSITKFDIMDVIVRPYVIPILCKKTNPNIYLLVSWPSCLHKCPPSSCILSSSTAIVFEKSTFKFRTITMAYKDRYNLTISR